MRRLVPRNAEATQAADGEAATSTAGEERRGGEAGAATEGGVPT